MKIQDTKLFRRTAAILFFVLPLFLCSGPVSSRADSENTEVSEKTVLRVAFPIVAGFTQLDEYGNHTGLIIDYLEEISKYTNWEYEYVETDSENLLNDAYEGKFDLIGGTYYAEELEDYFFYPDYSLGMSHATLLCRNDDDSLRAYDLSSMNGKTIGVYEKATEKIYYLQQFLNVNAIKCTLKYYTSEEAGSAVNLYQYLENNEVDLLLGNNSDAYSGFRIFTSFNAQPHYLVTLKGNQEILDGLNMALKKITEANPTFADECYRRNFPSVEALSVRFSAEEQVYIQEKKNVSVAAIRQWHPFFCLENEEENHQGLVYDFLENISARTGLSFQYVFADNYLDAIKLVQDGKADMLGFFLNNENTAKDSGLALTKSYASINSIIVKNKAVPYPGEGLTAAVVEGKRLPEDIHAANIIYYPTILDGLKAVNRGEVDFIYGTAPSLEQEIQNHRFSNVMAVSLINRNTEIAFALARPVDPELLSIMNKAIFNLRDEEVTDIINRNSISIGYISMGLSDLVYSNPVFFVAVFAAFLLLLVSIFLIIARNRIKASLMQAELKKAEAQNQAKTDFLSRMSHEIRTPMNAISGLTDLTCMLDSLPEAAMDNLLKIRAASQYLLSLINDILDMSRIDSGMMTIASEDFSLGNMLEEIKDMMRNQAKNRNLEFCFDINTTHDMLVGDPIRLKQVLTNLLSNAIKFTPEKGAVILSVLEKSYENHSASYTFSVKDTGPGIPAESQEKIFGLFEQLGSNYSKSQGTGLGLPISRNIVSLMGGELHLRSEIDSGSEFFFTVRFPVSSLRSVKPLEPSGAISLEGVRLLLAEDNDLNAEIAIELLKIRGAAVERAVNGAEAAEKFICSKPGYYQLILMDVQMPEKNGLEATRLIRQSQHPDAERIPILAMTANTFQEDVDTALHCGMNDFISKPVDSNYLYATIKKHLT